MESQVDYLADEQRALRVLGRAGLAVEVEVPVGMALERAD
jgi:hypothetical protein